MCDKIVACAESCVKACSVVKSEVVKQDLDALFEHEPMLVKTNQVTFTISPNNHVT